MDVAECIKRYNAGRDPERLRLKYAGMRASAFAFLRGTCHLFYRRIPREALRSKAPHAWACGDLHLENFGTFKGGNRLIYFDINDFDEGSLAPATIDLLRLLTSVVIQARAVGLQVRDIRELCVTLIDSYAAALEKGSARWLERDTAEGEIQTLLDRLRDRRRIALLDERTERRGKARRIRIDGLKALPPTERRREKVLAFMQRFADTQAHPPFYKVIDVARRVAGLGSLGVVREVILVEGNGSPDGNYLLDLKQSLPSSLSPCLKFRQPVWHNEAARVVAIQTRMQAVSPAFLHAVSLGKKSFVLRELQPREDRLRIDHHIATNSAAQALRTMGQLIAWAQLRSSGRGGSASADELIEFGTRRRWRRSQVEFAIESADCVEADWRAYCQAFDDGVFS
jgi:uncharacterized protein (DUF2252 family)